MANLASEQLTIIGQQLAEIDAQLEPIFRQQEELRAAALVIMQEYNEKSIKTLFGHFSRVAGRTTKTFTSEEFIAAKEALQIAQLRAENRGEFTTKVGEESIRFKVS
jgi:hypothetical protein